MSDMFSSETRTDLPYFAQDTAARIDLLGFRRRFLPNAPLAERGKRLQVRDTAELAPRNEVARYMQAIKRGDLLPPVILTRDGYLVDGHTRTEAARQAGWDYFPAFELDVNFEGAPDAMIKQLITLGAASNLTHGRGMSRKNIQQVIRMVQNPGDQAKDIAKKLHVPTYTVQSVMNVAKTVERAQRLGVDIGDESSPGGSHLALLGGRNVRYTDLVFKEFLTLMRDARYTVKDTKELGDRLEALGTEQDKLNLLARERQARSDVIAGAADKPRLSARLRQSLGFALANREVPGNLVEIGSQQTREDHRRVLYDTRDLIDKVIAMQENL